MRFRQKIAGLLTLLLILTAGILSSAAAGQSFETTVLFTHDLHSHFLPLPTRDGGETGGYARLKTAIDIKRELYPVEAGEVTVILEGVEALAE